ncbi:MULTISPECIES: 3-hydroxyisobutyrate dehydrogenase [Rhodomicrobium]|uniref:3-hydroxyisobutyrate dehydrogenase n=1 Tax=Rhodomicrobium TaxID=1068 RepID=UPI000B4BA99F|nr:MULTISPECIES: 3-hydroxyisobutyrate dehydrogenase [Rhodomicrobium]
MAAIGFIGLGRMGAPMAAHLVKAGHALKVFDLMPEGVARLTGLGAQAAANVADAASGVEAVVTMLPAAAEMRAVYLGPDGVLAAAAPGTLFMDCSTLDVASAREVAAEAEKAGMLMVDAPVSGGVGGAEAGTLTFMVGGGADAFAKAEPVLSAMGKAVVHAGGSGNGQAAKICNNMILGISMIAVSEAFVLAETLGLDKQKLFDISSRASGQCWSLTTYCPVPGPVPSSPANRDYAPGFTAAMMLKDLCLAQDAARAGGAATPLGAEAAEIYRQFAEGGGGATDFSGIVNFLREQKSATS